MRASVCKGKILFVVPTAPSVIVHQEQDRGIVKKSANKERESETNFEIGHTLTNMTRERARENLRVCVHIRERECV